jgi:serine/threonine-protein kinase
MAAQARAVLKTYCHRCHHGEGSEGGDFDVLQTETLTTPREGDKPYVVAGKPADSYLFQRMALRKGGKGDMPPKNIPERPSDADKALVRQWIEAGAPPFTEVVGRKFIPLKSVLTAIAEHLENQPRDTRPHLRYFTLTHLYNNPRVTDEDLRAARAALSKAINSLTWSSHVALPEPIDKEETILVLDVRDVDWDKNDLWREVLRAYPYGLKYRNHPELARLDERLCELTGCDMPLVRADWFVATATRPPLYHALLELPARACDLEKKLDVDIAASFLDPKPERIARAGFSRSGVSGQNRLVERHRAAHGAYWKSYDFKPDSGRAKLTRFPLGPLNLFPAGHHPFADQAFAHDGGEILYNLPNGLQGYLLVNGKDERIDEGPIQVVGDVLKTSGTPAIVTGVSCMACHKHGTIAFTDTVRDHSSVFGEPEQHLRRLYPEVKVMNRLLQEDETRFLGALEKAVGKFLRVGADEKKPLKDFAEPVGDVARRYRIEFLDLKAVALELDVEDPESLVHKIGEKRFKQLGLEALLKPGGVIGRLEWESGRGDSLMQEVAQELRFTSWQQVGGR